MGHHLTGSQLTVLIAATVAVAGLLLLVVYALHKALQQGRQELALRAKSPRATDEAAFAVAAFQGVLGDLRAQLNEASSLRRAAEQRIDEQGRMLSLIANEMEAGLLVFNREGFLTMANPAVRELLHLDTWARRRYPELLGADSRLSALVQACLESGQALRREPVERPPAQAGGNRSDESCLLEVSIVPLLNPTAAIKGAVCLLRERKQEATPDVPRTTR